MGIGWRERRLLRTAVSVCRKESQPGAPLGMLRLGGDRLGVHTFLATWWDLVFMRGFISLVGVG